MDSQPSLPGWENAWKAVAKYDRFLRHLARRYRAVLVAEGSEDADDLLHAFLVDRLPRVADRLDSLATEEQREKYLAVAFLNFARDHRRATLRYRRALREFGEEAPDKTPASARAPRPLPSVRVPLDPVLRAFFGGDSSASSIRRVAQELGISRYAARKAIVDGALVLVVQLGRQAVLSTRQVDVCEQVLLHGTSITETAGYLGLTETQVRQALTSARKTVGHYIND
jgi:hypothetical protein